MRNMAIAIGLLVFGASVAHAEPYEFIACNFNDGKGMADMDRWVASHKGVLDSTLDGYQATVLTLQYGDSAELPDFFWMGVWPDAGKLGLGLANWFEKGAGDKAMADLAKVADCASSSLWWGREVYSQK